MWLSDSSGCLSWEGLVLLERDFFCFVFFGVRRSEGGKTSLMMTDIPYMTSCVMFFIGSNPESIFDTPQVCPRKWSTFQVAGFTECFFRMKQKIKKKHNTIPPKRFSTKKVESAPFSATTFIFACVFLDKKTSQVLKSCTV